MQQPLATPRALATADGCRVAIAGQVDASSVEAIVRDVLAPLGPGATAEAKALALYRFVARAMFAFPSQPDDLHEDFNSAWKLLSWWGYGLCGTQSKTLGVLLRHALGRDNVRLMGMAEQQPDGWGMKSGGYRAFYWSGMARDCHPWLKDGHSSLEARWDDAWHLLDVMVGFYRRGADGGICSLEQLKSAPALGSRPVGDPDGDMPNGDESRIFTHNDVNFAAIDFKTWTGEPTPLRLRPGERFAWRAEPIPGAYWMHPSQRERFGSDALAPGPRSLRADQPLRRWGNGEHVYEVELRVGDAHWRPLDGDWVVAVELPYPVLCIEWELEEGATGFLHHAPTARDRLVVMAQHDALWQRESAEIATGYRVLVRPAAGRTSARLRLTTLVQLNPALIPRLRPGDNRVAVHGEGGRLRARFACRVDGAEREYELAGRGEHALRVDGSTVEQDVVELVNDA